MRLFRINYEVGDRIENVEGRQGRIIREYTNSPRILVVEWEGASSVSEYNADFMERQGLWKRLGNSNGFDVHENYDYEA